MCIVKCDYNIGGLNEELTEFQHYDYISGFRDGVAEVKLNEKWGFIDISGREICPCKYEDVGRFYEEMSRVFLNS